MENIHSFTATNSVELMLIFDALIDIYLMQIASCGQDEFQSIFTK